MADSQNCVGRRGRLCNFQVGEVASVISRSARSAQCFTGRQGRLSIVQVGKVGSDLAGREGRMAEPYKSCESAGSAGLGWVGLGRAGSGWVGLGWLVGSVGCVGGSVTCLPPFVRVSWLVASICFVVRSVRI